MSDNEIAQKKPHRQASKSTVFAVFLMLFLAFSLTITSPTFAAEPAEKIRVGYFDYKGFIEQSNDSFTGYGVSFLDEVSKYTSWQYEYVYDTWENLLQRLGSGDIDLLCTMQYTPERAAQFEFCKVSSGFETAGLCVSEDSEILYNDFESFEGMKIGMLQGSYQNKLFDDFAKLNNFTYEKITYSYMQDAAAAMINGEIDAYVTGGLSKPSNCRIVANFSVDPFYFVSSKGNTQLIRDLNNAMYQIFTTKPDFATYLYKQYYDDETQRQPVFTREEMQFIKDHPKLTVAFNPSMNTPTKTSLSGALYDTMQLAASKCGIEFEYIQPSSYTQCLELVQNGKADIISDVYPTNDFESKYGILCTDPYDRSSLAFIGKRGMNAVENAEYKVALEKDQINIDRFIKDNYTNYTVLYYDNEKACNDALINGEVELVVQSYEMAPHYIMRHPNQSITIVAASHIPFAPCFGVSSKLSKTGVAVLNKGIRAISASEDEYITIANNTVKIELSVPDLLVKYARHILAIVAGLGLLCLIIALNTRHRHNKELRRIAYTDILTGADNLTHFRIKAEKLQSSSANTHYAVVSLDINKFKTINDMYGYEVGDSIIIKMYEVLQSCVQKDELLARDVADRFVMLLQDADAHIMCERIEHMMSLVSALSEDKLKKSVFKIILSCGVCHIQNYVPPITSYIDHAYLAARTLKNSHCNCFAVYDTAMLEALNHEKELENTMDAAIRNHEFKVYQQPRINLATQKVSGSEALVRWCLTDGTLIMPDSFIPLFEKNGFIESVDFYMLESVCAMIRARLDAEELCLPVSINQSRFLFYQKDYLAKVLAILAKYDIPPSYIEIEITESLFLDPNEDFVCTLNALRDKGIVISLDDFGSGYSSLNMLRNIPLDIIKIDREFLRESQTAKAGAILIRKIVEMAKELEIEVVCEGVETREQMEFLKSIDCDYAQGYYYSKPIPCEQFTSFAQQQNSK